MGTLFSAVCKTCGYRKEKVASISKEEFFKHYQLWRNIIYAVEGLVVFVFVEPRKDLTGAVESAKRKCIHIKRMSEY